MVLRLFCRYYFGRCSFELVELVEFVLLILVVRLTYGYLSASIKMIIFVRKTYKNKVYINDGAAK